MNKIVNLFFLILIFNYINCQDPDEYVKKVQAFMFTQSRNPDFGYSLANDFTSDIVKENLNDKPEYLFGDNPTVVDGITIVHNAQTFSQWFKSSVKNDIDYCYNYGVLLDANFYFGGNGGFEILNIDDQLVGKGFNNASRSNDNLFTWYTKFNIYAIIPTRDIGIIYVSMPYGELLVYEDGELVYELLGKSQGILNIPLEISVDGFGKDYEFFGAHRQPFPVGDIKINVLFLNVICNEVDDCETCGPAETCENKCIDDLVSCIHSKYVCGACQYNVARNCDDLDPCTLDQCIDGIGCEHTPIEGCEACNETNCITTDLCFPKVCEDEVTCRTHEIICVANETCFDPYCVNGECECTPTPSTVSHTTIATTTSETTASTIATTIATSTSITTTSGTTTSETSISSSTTNRPHYLTQCNESSCPHHYCCVQLHQSFTCVSKIFEEKCDVSKLKEFY